MSQLIIGLRVLRRQGLYGFMAVLGLAIGLTVAITALLYTWQETNYDSHIPNSDRIFIVDANVSAPGRTDTLTAQTPGALSTAMRNSISDVEDAARVLRQWSTLAIDDQFNFNLQILGVEKNWLPMIDLPMVQGTYAAFENEPTAAIISTSLARRLYGDELAVGQTFLLDSTPMSVVGVFEDFPATSHMDIDLITPENAPAFTGRRSVFDGDWRGFFVFNYVLLREDASFASTERAVEELLHQNFQLDGRWPENLTAADIVDTSLQSLSSLHMNGKTYPFGIRPPADKLKLTVLGAIAILIVIIACVNHVNLSTVRSIERAREVSMRKILGAGRAQLISQFLIEAVVLALVALLIALVLVELSNEFANDLLQTNLDLSLLTGSGFMAWIFGLLGFVVLTAGLYPAYIISGTTPGRVLSSHARGARGNSGLRSTLVVFQFAVSICLAIGAAVIWSQLRYARQADPGFNADNVVMLYGVGRSPKGTINLTRSIDQAISGRPGIELVSASNSSPAWDYVPEVTVRKFAEGPESAQTMGRVSVDLDFFEMLDIAPVAGRLFSEDYGADRIQWDYDARSGSVMPVVINQRALASFGFGVPSEAIGQQIQFTLSASDERTAEVVGVVPDIHFKSFRSAIQPMVFYPDPSVFSVMMVRIDPTQRDVAFRSIEEGWGEVLSDQAVSNDFLAATIAQQYDSEAQELKTVTVLASLGILIAIFGQYGLAAYSAQSRRREISIRKVLGARVRDILQLFVWQFSKPVFVAMLVAWPVAFFAMSAWLENFVYRIAPNPLWFVLAGLFALTVALLTVAGHALKAAHTAPVEALRYE